MLEKINKKATEFERAPKLAHARKIIRWDQNPNFYFTVIKPTFHKSPATHFSFMIAQYSLKFTKVEI